MLKITQKHNNESFESLLRRFKKAVEKEDIIREYTDREFFTKPSMARKRERELGKKRAQRASLGKALPERQHT